MKTHRYLIEEKGAYSYRRRVPGDVIPIVGTRVWKRRFGTVDRLEAESRVRAIAHEHDHVIAAARGLPLPDKVALLDFRIGDARDQLLVAPDDPKASADLADAMAAMSKIERAMFAAGEQRLDTLPASEREAVAKAGGLKALYYRTLSDAQSLPVELAIQKIPHASQQPGYDREVEVATLNVLAQRSARNLNTLTKLKLLSDDSQSGFEDPKNPRINSAIEKWFKDRKQGDSAVKRHRVAMRRLVELHGNIPVRDITRDMVRTFRDAIEQLPDQRRVPVKMRGGLEGGAELPRVCAKTVERHLTTLKAFLTWCLDQDWIPVNVATGIKPPKDTRPKALTRRPFERDELKQFYKRVVEEEGANSDKAWFVKLCAYSGIRIEEAAQLARKNVRKLDGVWVIEINDLDGRNVKTETSIKQIPLHPAIRDHFVKWVAKGKSDFVFASFKPKSGRFANRLSGDFARLLDRAGLADPRLTFHSLRHTMKREMSNARVDPDMRRQILGHAARSAHDAYAGASLSVLADELAKVPKLL